MTKLNDYAGQFVAALRRLADDLEARRPKPAKTLTEEQKAENIKKTIDLVHGAFEPDKPLV